MSTNDTLYIKFPGSINSKNFERILKQYYSRSKLRKFSKVQFNFLKVKWCGIFELSIIALWIEHLSKNKKIIFISPADQDALNFLSNYSFYNFLKESIVESDYSKIRKPYAPAKSPMFPLTFNDKHEFNLLLKELSDSKRAAIIFKDISESELVKSNAIHSIIFKELTDNVFIHTNCKYVNYIVTKIGDSENLKYTEKNKGYYDVFEEKFFLKLSGREYITIVVSDKGSGIYKKLIDSYKTDRIIDQVSKKDVPTESDIIKYAFLKHSTSRTDDERKKDLKALIDSEYLKYPLPTGLYKVLNIVKNYFGFLLIRSGKSFVCYDFFSHSSPVITDNSDYYDYRDLAYYPGTQFKFYFPVEVPYKESYSFSSLPVVFHKSLLKPIFKYVSLDKYLPIAISKLDNTSVSSIQSLLDEVDSCFASPKNNTILIFDACNFRTILHKNIIHIIISHLMLNQNEKICSVVVHLSSKKINDLIEDYEGLACKELKPIVCFDNLYRAYIIGATKDERYCFDSIINNETIQFADDRISNLKHLIHKEFDGIYFNFSKKQIIEFLLKSTSIKLNNYILEPESSIFNENIKILIPDRYYCLGFFEISNVFSNQYIVEALKFHFSLQFINMKPDYVLTLGENCKSIIEQLYNDYLTSGISLRARKIHINYPLNLPQIHKISQNIETSKSIIFIADVIGTSYTLKNVLSNLKNHNIIKIISIINTNSNIRTYLTTNFKNYEFDSIVSKYLEFHRDMPKNWLYSEVHLVDTNSNRVIQKSITTEGPLWIKIRTKTLDENGNRITIFENPFLEKIVSRSKSFYNGHFVSRSNHLTCLFNIPVLIENYSNRICKIINDYVVEQMIRINTNRRKKLEISYILFPTFNPGLEKIASLLASRIKKCLVLPISEEDVYAGIPNRYDFTDSAVIIIDDAIVSGSTIDRLIDITSNRKASHIFVFALLKRGSSFQGRRFEKTKQYGETTLQARYLVDAEIPIYKELECPICDTIRDLKIIKKRIRSTCGDKLILEQIDSLLANYTPKKISTIFEEELNIKTETKVFLAKSMENISIVETNLTYANIRWKLELSKSHFGPRTELNKIVKDYIHDPNAALLVINVIADEKKNILNNPKLKKNIFYYSFRNNLMKACFYFLENIEKINDLELFSVINIIISFDEDSYIDKLPELINKIISCETKFLTLLISLLLTETSSEYPIRVSILIEEVAESLGNKKYVQTLNNIIFTLKNIFKQKQETKKIRVESYEDIKLRSHNINHKIIDCLHYCEPHNFKEGEVRKKWEFLYDELKNIKKSLNLFRESLTSDRSIKKINQLLTKLDLSINQIVSEFTNMSYFANFPVYLKRIWKHIVFRDAEDGLVHILEQFEVDIFKICYQALEKEKERFEQKNKWFDFEFPNLSFSVLGEEPDVLLIFDNLIENSLIHADGTFLYITGFIDCDLNNFDILFIDDGKNNFPFKFGVGLNSVNQSCISCGGVFDIRNRKESFPYKNRLEKNKSIEEFNTVAMVSLPLIKEN